MRSLKWLLPASISPGGVPVASHFSERFSKISKWVWPWLLSKCYFCPESQHTWDFAHALEKLSLCFLQPSGSPVWKPCCLPFKARHSGVSSSWCRTSGMGSLMWGSDASLLGEKLCSCDYPPVCGSPTQGCRSWVYHVSVPLFLLVEVPSLCL